MSDKCKSNDINAHIYKFYMPKVFLVNINLIFHGNTLEFIIKIKIHARVCIKSRYFCNVKAMNTSDNVFVNLR